MHSGKEEKQAKIPESSNCLGNILLSVKVLYIQILIPNENVIVRFDHIRVQKPFCVPPEDIKTVC